VSSRRRWTGRRFSRGELEFFRAVSGGDVAPGKPTPEAYLTKPRRAGGTLFAFTMPLETAARACRALAHVERESAAKLSALRGPVQQRAQCAAALAEKRSEEHTSELQSL
jgi:hypothetical protein